MQATTAVPDRTLTLPRVAAALCGIALLALVLPYAAVRSLHERRLNAAERQMQAIAAGVAAALGDGATSIPGGTHILAGPGPRPLAQDDLWTTAPVFPLARIAPGVSTDPWGNAYLLRIRDRRAAWIISAGPDGILQTPFGAPHGPVGDDRVVHVR